MKSPSQPQGEFQKLTVEPLPFHLNQNSSVFRGSIGRQPVVVKEWRSLASLSIRDKLKFDTSLRSILKVWGQLSSHPNIASFIGLNYNVLDHNVTTTSGNDALPRLLLPRCPNGNACMFVKENPGADVLQILCGASAGLRFLHAQNPPIIHGKVKGSNILINEDGEACLTDVGMFNVAYPVDLTMTPAAGSMEEVRWMAPEMIDPESRSVAPPRPGCIYFDRSQQCQGRNQMLWEGGNVDGCNQNILVHEGDIEKGRATPASDVYSFGMTMLEVITKERPFCHHRRVVRVIMDVVSGIRPPRQGLQAISDEVWDIISECWVQDSGERPSMDRVDSWLKGITGNQIVDTEFWTSIPSG